jgi:hypothetical protein
LEVSIAILAMITFDGTRLLFFQLAFVSSGLLGIDIPKISFDAGDFPGPSSIDADRVGVSVLICQN